MGIEQICNSIKNLFTKVRNPFPEIPKILLVCSMIKRPGLSTIQSTANIVKDLAKLGIPTGSMPDGSANLTVGLVFASTKEIFRGIKFDMKIQGGIVPGSLLIAGAGGGSNANPSNVYSQAS